MILVQHRGIVTNRSYRAVTGRSAQTAASDLKRFTEIGLLERHGRGRAVVYRLSQEAVRILWQADADAVAEAGRV